MKLGLLAFVETMLKVVWPSKGLIRILLKVCLFGSVFCFSILYNALVLFSLFNLLIVFHA